MSEEPLEQEAPFIGPVCIHCGQAPALENAVRCLDCQWDLYEAMNGAINGLRDRVRPQNLQGRTQHLLETLAQKRARAATNRFDVVPARRLR
ncbi:MAG: hypothetical protein IT368_17775 [Candidatus Hydrogenedentes bacterium]|nr:hypothetical protein [Candidatus Hydrogenedentota bacterium]